VAKTRPARLGLPFTHWSIRKLAGYLDGDYGHQDPRVAIPTGSRRPTTAPTGSATSTAATT